MKVQFNLVAPCRYTSFKQHKTSQVAKSGIVSLNDNIYKGVKVADTCLNYLKENLQPEEYKKVTDIMSAKFDFKALSAYEGRTQLEKSMLDQIFKPEADPSDALVFLQLDSNKKRLQAWNLPVKGVGLESEVERKARAAHRDGSIYIPTVEELNEHFRYNIEARLDRLKKIYSLYGEYDVSWA